MAAARTPRRRDAELAFDAIFIEGGLLAPEWLSRITLATAEHQAPADYRIDEGLTLRDEIARYWRMAQAQWAKFSTGRAAGGDPKALAETFVSTLLRKCFGFGTLNASAPTEIQGRVYPIGFSALEGRVPVVIAPAGLGLDTHAPMFGDGHRKRSAFGLAQECLNADERCVWGLVTDGVSLRLLRDNASFARPAWLEADIARIFTEERYAEFSALWLLLHESRFGAADAAVTDCPLEQWRSAGQEEGTRARDQLRDGVEAALIAFGHGFLNHPDNGAIREALREGKTLTTKTFHQQLLRLVYRLLFLLTAEERGVLLAPEASEAAKSLYDRAYGMRRLRARAVKRQAHDRFSDVWESVKVVFRGLASGEPRLGLPALAGLFAADQCPALDAAKLENQALLGAMFRLSYLRKDAGIVRVNWRDFDTEELGSVYESLLELVPVISNDARTFDFAKGAETKGNARKTTGSYYTPKSLVHVLLDSALEPVITSTIAAHPTNAVEALLGLSVVDPACGSGHFLLAAAQRLGHHVARLQADGTPSREDYRHAVRQVVGRCLYGVDLNPMAVELCKVSLWMEAVEPGRPLSFLDAHIRHGNALLGTTETLQEKGIPDEAWEALEGDEKKVATALKKRNKKSAGGQRGFDLFSRAGESGAISLSKEVAAMEAFSDADLSAIEQKRAMWGRILASDTYVHKKFVADLWCAAFVWPKVAGIESDVAPTNDVWLQVKEKRMSAPAKMREIAEGLAEQYHFFHWELEFSPIFARGGFDVVLGNPPWERVKLQEQEFFASRSDEIANAANAAARKKLIAALPEKNERLWKEWCAASREAEGQSHFVRQSTRYPLCGKGDVNTYALFAEHNRNVVGPKGRAGFIVPTGIATDDTTKEYFGALVNGQELFRFYSFENEEFIFPSVHHAFKFALLAIDRSGQSKQADLIFFARQIAALADASRHFSLTPGDFALLNPNTRTCPTFRDRRDAEINLKMYRRAGVLWREENPEENAWSLRFLRMLDMANDSGLFHTQAQLVAKGLQRNGNQWQSSSANYVPLVEAKMVHHFDHRFGSYEGQTQAQANQGKLPEFNETQHQNPDLVTIPDYWVDEKELDTRLAEKWNRRWLLGWRDICRSTDQRTVIASLIPRVAVGHTTPLLFSEAPPVLVAALYANLCSFILDYAARQKVGGTHLTYGYLKQLPVLPPSTYEQATPWSDKTLLRDWILPRVLELTYTAWDLEAFGKDVGYDGPPFRWDAGRRFLLRAELDAAFFHLYGISREDADYILDTFPIVRKNDEKAHGEYRTKRVILEVYDAMAEAVRTGKTYVTRLAPGPADPSVAHAPRG